MPLTQAERLANIAQIIESVDNRCMSADGPVTATRDEITGVEMREIYRLATIPTAKRHTRKRSKK